jgi:macrodomain Ter protein organizer (MatP/YcbG family)
MATDFQPDFITLEDVLKDASRAGAPTAAEIQANYAQIVEEVEALYGPDVPSLVLHLMPKIGRPKNGEAVEPVKTKSIKMPPALWDKIGNLASKQGLTLHAYVRTVLIDAIDKAERAAK